MPLDGVDELTKEQALDHLRKTGCPRGWAALDEGQASSSSAAPSQVPAWLRTWDEHEREAMRRRLLLQLQPVRGAE